MTLRTVSLAHTIVTLAIVREPALVVALELTSGYWTQIHQDAFRWRGNSKLMHQSVQSARMDAPPAHFRRSAQFVEFVLSSIYQHHHLMPVLMIASAATRWETA